MPGMMCGACALRMNAFIFFLLIAIFDFGFSILVFPQDSMSVFPNFKFQFSHQKKFIVVIKKKLFRFLFKVSNHSKLISFRAYRQTIKLIDSSAFEISYFFPRTCVIIIFLYFLLLWLSRLSRNILGVCRSSFTRSSCMR